MTWSILRGDVLERLRGLESESVHCVVTSPPYWGLRDYGVEGQLGLEPTPDEYVAKMVAVFAEIRRVLRSDGTLWMNMGDCYATGAGAVGRCPGGGEQGERFLRQGMMNTQPNRMPISGLKPKDLVGMPWRLAFALQADGWWLRQDIIWSKPSPMPESVQDRCTKAHEYVFLMSKSARYYYDNEAIKEDSTSPDSARGRTPDPKGWDRSFGEGGHGAFHRLGREGANSRMHQDRDAKHGNERKVRTAGNKTHKTVAEYERSGSEEHRTAAGLLNTADTPYPKRNKRSVWEIASYKFAEAHFATFPPKLVEPCVLAGCPEGGTVLDPFSGAGTTGLVATRLGRNYLGIELNDEYADMSERRIRGDNPLFNGVGA